MNNNPRSHHIHTTPTTLAQSTTEDEVSPFFVDLATLSQGSLDHLRDVGLLPPLVVDVGESIQLLHDDDESLVVVDDDDADNPKNSNNNTTTTNHTTTNSNYSFDPYAIRLLRAAHIAYLTKALDDPLSRGFVSLDASHPWMIYWIVHSLDLLGYFDDDINNNNTSNKGDALGDVEGIRKGHLLNRIVSTLEACWTEDVPVNLLREEVMHDERLRQLMQRQENDGAITDDGSQRSSAYVTLQAGGFGGGPSQMPHCAPTYAAVLSLSIVASLGGRNNSKNEYKASREAALRLLSQKRLQLYAFFVSLRVHDDDDDDTSYWIGVNNEKINHSTAFRMQHDGETDVRASYCILSCAYLLGLLDRNDDDDNNSIRTRSNLLTAPSISRHIAACQTHEGGFGAEPHNEAHGGYTFCALAALRILNSIHTIDVSSLRGWLARRQLGFEGGFCGRTNKLVDGCYSFWLGGAIAVLDGWLLLQQRDDVGRCDENDDDDDVDDAEVTFDELLLQRYILLCAQDVNGGLRDKPSKQRDFYHSCYNLSGLSVAQHKLLKTRPPCNEDDSLQCSNHDVTDNLFGDKSFNVVGRTDPVINIRVERVQFMLKQCFK